MGGQFTGGQATDICPQCGSTANVHSIGELAALAQMQLDQIPGGAPQPGAPQQGWNAEPQSGPVPGWAAEPQAGPPPGSGGWSSPRGGFFDNLPVGRFHRPGDRERSDGSGRAIHRAGGGQERAGPRHAGREAGDARSVRTSCVSRSPSPQQHPDIRACMTDHVIFLAGGSRTLPMPNLGTITTQQADTLVAQLQPRLSWRPASPFSCGQANWASASASDSSAAAVCGGRMVHDREFDASLAQGRRARRGLPRVAGVDHVTRQQDLAGVAADVGAVLIQARPWPA